MATFIPNTAYGWTLNPATAGTIITSGANQLRIVWNNQQSGPVQVVLNYASNQCGVSSGSINVNIWPKPVASAGPDLKMCEGESLPIGGSPTGSGGTPSFVYSGLPAKLRSLPGLPQIQPPHR